MTTSSRAQSTRTGTAKGPGTGQMGTGGTSSGQQRMGQSDNASILARSGSILATSLLVLLGVFHFFAGIAGFARNNFYSVGSNYPYQLSSNGWGWIHVVGGVLLAITGLALFSRSATWARPVAIVLLLASAIANFFFLAYFPLWALLMIGVAVFCIWSVAREGSENRQAMGAAAMQQYGYGQPGRGMQQQDIYGTGATSQTGQRWPENIGNRDEGAGRHWAPSDVKESAGRMGENRMGDKPQQQQQQQPAPSGARGGGGQPGQAGQAGQSAAEQAAQRAQQAGRDYRSNR